MVLNLIAIHAAMISEEDLFTQAANQAIAHCLFLILINIYNFVIDFIKVDRWRLSKANLC